MPRGDGTGPRGTERRNSCTGPLGRKGTCNRNNASGGNRLGNNPVQTDRLAKGGKSATLFTALAGLATAAIPILLKVGNLIANAAPEQKALSGKPAPKTIVVKPEMLPTDSYEEDGNRLDK